MTTAIPLTLHLLVLMGIYELAAGVAGFTGSISWPAIIDEFDRSPALTFMTGFVVFALGGGVIFVHCIWTDPLAIVVSAIGWIAAVEGLLLMAAPRPLLAISRRMVANQGLISLLATGFGLLLILLGTTGRADPTTL